MSELQRGRGRAEVAGEAALEAADAGRLRLITLRVRDVVSLEILPRVGGCYFDAAELAVAAAKTGLAVRSPLAINGGFLWCFCGHDGVVMDGWCRVSVDGSDLRRLTLKPSLLVVEDALLSNTGYVRS